MKFVQYIVGFSKLEKPLLNVIQMRFDSYVLNCEHRWEILDWGTRGVLERCLRCKVRRVTERGVGFPCKGCGMPRVDSRLDNFPHEVPPDDVVSTYVCVNDRCPDKHAPGAIQYKLLDIP